MKIFISIGIFLLTVFCLSPHAQADTGNILYTCGMHPQIIQDHPGNCPICGMKLTPIHDPASASDSTNSTVIAVNATMAQNMNLRTTEVLRGVLNKTIRTVGAIDYNETALALVTTKFKGWVEKLDVDATGELVHRGEPLFEIYSPELYSAEEEYLLALNSGSTNDPGVMTLRETAADKLRFYDVPEADITALEKTRTLRKTLPVAAPMSGFVIEKNVLPGQMVEAGTPLYRLADLGIVWVLAQIYEQDLPYVQLGQEAVVKVASLPDREFRGRVTFIYPNLDEKTRTARVRLEFENPGYYLKPGMFVSAEINAPIKTSAILVPDSAILRSGTKNTVFVTRAGGMFEPREVVLGAETDDGLCEVISGVDAGEKVVTSGEFMLDSESQLREAIEKMRDPKTPGATAETTPATNSSIAANESGEASGQSNVVYVCPMPEHVSIVYNHPGNCPICGMALVPVSPSALAKIQPGGRVLYYTCPMPEHASVHEDKPGKCPLCGMTLIPVMAPPITAPASAPAVSPASKTLSTDYHASTNH